MALRPNTLEVISSTQIEIGFNKKLSKLISADNFSVSSSAGLDDNLKILSVLVAESSLILTTNPQVSGNLYLLTLKDSAQVNFISEDGDRLVNDDVNRLIYFVGAESYNPIRDRIFLNVPKTYNLDGSNIRNILSAQADDLYQVEKHIGEVLSDNYISVRVEDEYRIRSKGAKDRLSHENAYLVESISRFASNRNLIFKELYFNNNSNIDSQKFTSDYPISLQQELSSEEIIFSNLNDNISGYLIKLNKNNVIKLERLSIIKENVSLCETKEYVYNIDRFKYSLKDNRYDPNRAFSYVNLNSNEILLSESSGFIVPDPGDKIKVSYLYKDTSEKINTASIIVYNIESVKYELIPQESTRFFLKNAPITNQSGEPGSIGDVLFYGDNNIFLYEIPYNTSKLPSSFGEYTINYETGEIIVYGTEGTFGTGYSEYHVDYFYRKTYINNLDYYIDNSDLVATTGRYLQKANSIIAFNYQQQFVQNVDYIPETHIEVLNEQVYDNLLSSFTLKTKNAPITKVFSLFNQTTGETYQPTSFYKNEVTFSSINPPRFYSEKSYVPTFDNVQSESIKPYFKFSNSIFKFKIIENNSLNNIVVYPPIPYNLIESNPSDYVIKNSDNEVQNMTIRFFSDPDGNMNVDSFALTATSDLPILGSEYILGIECLSIQLNNKNILNKQNNAIGSFLDSSLSLDENIFIKEKYFFKNIDFYESTKSRLVRNQENAIASTIAFSNITKLGDYLVDYTNGIVHVGVGKNYDISLGYASYFYSKILSNDKNILTCNGVYRKASASDKESLYDVSKFSLNNGINLENLNNSFEIPNNSKIFDLNLNEIETNIVTENYLIYTRLRPTNFYGLYKLEDLFGNLSNNLEFRKNPISKESALNTVKDGGSNLYLNEFKIIDNYLDLKSRKTFKAKNNSGFNFYIPKENFGFIFEIKNLTLNIDISDQTLDGLKTITEIYNIENNDEESLIYIDSNLNINLINDYIKDNVGLKFKILSYDGITGETIVSSISDGIDFISPSIGLAKIVNEITIDEVGTNIVINISDDCLINNYDNIEITFLKDFIPTPGTRLATWYQSGSIFYDLTYSNDNLVISYEYGDNEINWQVSNILKEGEPYYVTYKYGALRDSLKNNFGILTKIPFFTKFSKNTDREIYRKALQGTIEAFSRGPVIPSFENLVQKFTEQKPNISESFFGSWILGRDLLNPQNIEYSGELKFESGKFDSGLLIDDMTEVRIPSKTSINLDEGTFSCWIRNDWNGIDNDANITFDFSKMSEINFTLKINSNIFNDQNFDLFMSEDKYGFVDWSGDYLSIYNYQNIGDEEKVGPFGITKYHDRLNASKHSKHIVSLSADISATSKSLSSFYKTDSGTISERLSIFGMGGLMPGTPVVSRGYLGDGLEIFLNYYSSPFVFSIGDDNSVFMLAGSLIPIINNENSRLYVLKIEEEDVEFNTISNYDGPFLIKNCNCSFYTDIDSLELFRDSDFNEVRIKILDGIDISYLSQNFNLLNNELNGFKYLLEDGRIYSINRFADINGNKIELLPEDGIIYGFYVNKIPDNQQFISGLGSSILNESIPSGTGIILFPTISVIREKFDSENLYNFDSRPIIVNYTSKNINITIDRKPILNNITFKINNYTFDIAYSDLLKKNNYSELFEFLNLSSWFNSEYGLNSYIDGINDLNNKMFIGCLDPVVKSRINISSLSYSIEESIDLSNIFIGSEKVNPKNYIFTLNKDLKYVYGLPEFNSENKSIYIWMDEGCKIDGNNVGSWKLKSIIPNQSIISIGTDGYTSIDGYNTDYEYVELEDYIEGKITTDGGFSYAKTIIDESGCAIDSCDLKYRFCGQSLLEDGGWKEIKSFGSDLINTIIGGTEYFGNNWLKSGNFNTSLSSGIYKINNIESIDSYLYLPLYCMQDFYYEISFKVLDFDHNIIGSSSGSFSGNISGNLIGLNIAEIFDDKKYIKLALAANSSMKYIVVIDGISGFIFDIIPFDWFDNNFNSIQISLNKNSDLLIIYHKNNILSRIRYSNFENYTYSCEKIIERGIFIRLNDQEITSNNFINIYNQPIIEIDFIELTLESSIKDSSLEDNDQFLVQENSIDFKFYNKADGYLDEYGYMESGSDTDTIVFVSDLNRYIFDSGESDFKNRISLYKDFYGYLNFRIYDSLFEKEKNLYNISSNIKHFKPGDFHHLGVSWRLNTEFGRDEMHLYIDGKEAPSIYKFGGYISPWKDSKVGDVARDVIQDYADTKINYYESYNDGQILAGQTYILSTSSNFTDNDIGKTIIIEDGGLASDLNNKAFIIGYVDGSMIYLLDIDNLAPYLFTTSSNNIRFYRPPNVPEGSVGTIFSASKFEVYKIDCSRVKEELGGILYKVENGVISLINNNVTNPMYRVNILTGSIDFLYKDKNCNWSPSVSISDLDIWIENFGLNKIKVFEKINYSSNRNLGPNYLNNITGFITNMPEPIDLGSVKIKRVILDNTIPDGTIEDGIFNFEIINNFDVSSKYQIQNNGRLISIKFDSDNINYCNDGYSSENYLHIEGENVSGAISEYVYINENKIYNLNNFYTKIEKISGKFNLVDSNYETIMISIFETNDITKEDNNGDSAEIYRYSNGVFFISTKGSNGQDNYLLPSGLYIFEYPSFIRMSLKNIGEKIFIGTDKNGKNNLKGLIDEVKIITEMSGDTRDYQSVSTYSKSITEEYISNKKPCLDDQTIFLCHFDDPFEMQIRKLRNKIFLNTKDNFKYKLNNDDLKNLSKYLNNKEKFIIEMKKLGHIDAIAEETYIESHMADGGPIFNEARYSDSDSLIVGFNSVNANFGYSGKFFNTSPISYNQKNIFDKNNGTIEFWISPLLSTNTDTKKRVIFDSCNVKTAFVKPLTSGVIELPTSAEKIISITLPELKDSDIYNANRYDEISLSKISGRLDGGTGVLNDFSKGSTLRGDGKIIDLKTRLISDDFVVVKYFEKNSSQSRIKIYFENEKIYFDISNKDLIYSIYKDIDWNSNSWHKVTAAWRVNTEKDYMKLSVDGSTDASSILNGSIKIGDVLEQINIGNSYDGSNTSMSRIDNFRISKIDRLKTVDLLGNYLDLNYSSNLNSLLPLSKDIYTSYINNFDTHDSDNYITITDSKRGIYDFDIDIIDDFSKINSAEIEDLIVYLINKLKPSHTNVLVRFKRKSC